ncbi:efflux RND transporter periplasmic adaptor subunit [Cellvibrio sp. KY-YJ-3]|jgi:HlyD family secretion protein|uniref:efflux RND transporter periplasmic adaptor subunit n=1 Tax=Cellvibrio sp. KY-YJ-3 TaxID=454662 RepID=UPI001246A19A|nr:efflux RND transporter periplasmic adaptor subunit [Cellvibrio sp. KY-YJ-3]QEY13628.1 efflux RND transporter periplasmic adaptor subunit [Cellvibrio sp. KY-YJ-3]
MFRSILNMSVRTSGSGCLPLLALCSVVSSYASAQTSEPAQLNCRIEPSVVVEMSSAVEGVISEVLVDKNDSVKKGEVVARLDAGLEMATAELRRVQAELISDVQAQQLAVEFSKRSLERVTDLYEKKAASFSELDKLKTEYAIAQQQLQQALDRKRQAELEHNRALADLKRRTLASPIDGVVVERYKQPGEHIDFEPVLKLAQLDPLRVEVFAPASLYGKVQAGMTATVVPELGASTKSYDAKVILVDQVIDGPSNTFGIRLAFPNPGNRLPSGLKCRVTFEGVTLNLLDTQSLP